MNDKYVLDDKTLSQQIRKACTEISKPAAGDMYCHTFSAEMHIRMHRTFEQERRYRLWQRAKAVIAVLLTLLVAAAVILGWSNQEEIKLALDSFINYESQPPFGKTPEIEFSDDIKQDYQIAVNYTAGVSGSNMNDWWGKALLICYKNGEKIEIEYYPTQNKEPKDPDYEGPTVWDYPASLSGTVEKTLRWTDGEHGVYFVVKTTATEEELMRVVQNMTVE